jgi:hypothetical protein
MPPAHLFYDRARGLGAGGQTQWGLRGGSGCGLKLAHRRPQSPASSRGGVDTETLPHSLADAEFEL